MKPALPLALVLVLALGGVWLCWRVTGPAAGPEEQAAALSPSPTAGGLGGRGGGAGPIPGGRVPLGGTALPAQPELQADPTVDEDARAAALAAWRARQAADFEQRLAQRQLEAREWTHQRALRFANELDLPPGSELRIAEILLATDERFALVREEARTLGSNREGRAHLSAGVAEARAWRDRRFEEVFGPDLARRILAFEDNETDLGMSPERPPGPEEEFRDDERQD